MAPILQRFVNRVFSLDRDRKCGVLKCEIMILYPTDSRTSLGRAPNEASMFELAMVGWREWVGIPELDEKPLLAKMDTGAWSSTLHASDIEIIESDLENRVRFRLDSDGKWIERPVFGWRRIRDTSGHETLRPVIRTSLEMAGMDFDIELCLQDRSLMRHRLILGRRFLRGNFCVHPGQECIHPSERTVPRISIGIETI